MKHLLLIMAIIMFGCETPIRITETYTTDSLGRVTKIIKKYYDSTHENYYAPPMYYQPYPYWQIHYYNPIYIMPRNTPRYTPRHGH